VECVWEPAGKARDVYGDNKSSKKGAFHLMTIKSTTTPPDYFVRIFYRYPMTHEFFMGPVQPPNESVVEELKRRAAEDAWGEA
jgi:hypothetical protein